MAKRKFTEEEMNHLRASAHVIDVSPNVVHFSAEFKAKFWNLLLSGKSPRAIVVELGIDPEILGETRISGLKSMIRNEAHAGKGFRDIETYRAHIEEFINPEIKVKHLEQQLAYRDQEIEFLKKIVSLSQEDVDS